jgi:hypothetical protein
MASVSWDDYESAGGLNNARDYPGYGGGNFAGQSGNPLPPFVDTAQTTPAAANDTGQAGGQSAPWWITKDYWAPDRNQVLADPTRWGTDPNAPKPTTPARVDPEGFRPSVVCERRRKRHRLGELRQSASGVWRDDHRQQGQ